MAKKNSRDRRRQRREDAEERATAREGLAESGHAHCKEFRRLYTVGVKDNPSMAEGLPGPSRDPEEYDA